jgi:hypothetical protein
MNSSVLECNRKSHIDVTEWPKNLKEAVAATETKFE